MPTNLEIPNLDTLADLVSRLGDVPLARIRLSPAPGLATEDDVLRADGALDKRLCELVDGVLVEKAMGFPESLVAVFLARYLGNFVADRKLGIVSGADGMLRVLPKQIRAPDVAYFSWGRLPGRKAPSAPIPAIVPDLAIEVISPGNTDGEMQRKRRDYFTAGVLEIWEFYPLTRTAIVYRSAEDFTPLNPQDTLSTPLLTGLSLPLMEVFAVLDEQG